MSLNLFNLLKDQFSDDLISKASGFLGESSGNTKTAVMSAIPSLLGGFINKTSDSNGASTVFNMLGSGNHDGGILNNLSNVFSGGNSSSSILSSGGGILSSLFGGKLDGISNIISSVSGMSKGSSSSLLGLLAPIVMGMIGKQVKSQGITSASGLTSMLGSQKDLIKGYLPAGFSSALGLSSIDDLGGKVSSTVHAAKESVEDAGSGFKKFLPWILLALLAAAILYFTKGCGKDEAKAVVTETVDSLASSASEVMDSAGTKIEDATAAVAGFFNRKLTTGFELNAPENGVENKLVMFVEDAGKVVDKTTWFTMDRLTFETGKSTLMQSSNEQLNNILEIMKAFPNLELKIGGYTDNTGDVAKNLSLSAARANMVMETLVKMGVDSKRLKAEGFGDQFPVASNDTEEGRAQNRRIDLRVSKK
jgi:OmpA-OmpF porin, OOP family